ncbi:MAG TPA: hypothetical protein VNS63_25170 [Blastocatellia bacterium]|nr:hypothetical protein [Blastocatellia bacterium]
MFALVLLIFATLAGGVQDPAAIAKVPLNEEFRLKVGHSVVIKGHKLSLRFNAVQDESRCPTGVQCVWAGNAAVVVEVSKDKNKRVRATLNTNTSIKPNELEYKDYKIRLVGLNPYPNADHLTNPKEYEAIFLVTKD